MSPNDKELFWLHGVVKTPPLSKQARIVAGYMLRLLQKGEKLSLPQSRPTPSIGKRCHELGINDKNSTTPKQIIDICKNRIKDFNNESS